MKLYRVSYRGGDDHDVPGEHLGYEYYGTKSETMQAIRNQDLNVDFRIEEVFVRPVKHEIVKMLNRIADHPDNS